MKNYYDRYTFEERKRIAEEIIEEHVVKSIVESNRHVINIAQDTGINAEELIKHRDKVIKRKFGI